MPPVVKGAWAKVSESHFVHQEAIDDIEWCKGQGFKPYLENTLEESRAQVIRECYCRPDFVQFKGSFKEIVIPVPHLKEGIPSTVYCPERKGDEPQTIIVYYHGGGLVIANRECFHPQSLQLAMRTEAIIVLPEYRRLPQENDDLAPFDDCLAVTEWVLKNKEAVGGQVSSKVGVAGDSAGGQIASSMTHSIKEGIAFQVLVYPVAGMNLETASLKEFYTTPSFNGLMMERMFQQANHDNDEIRKNPRANPAARSKADLATCPPTMVLLAILDPLIDWGRQFAEKLKVAGVETEVAFVEGVPHSFFTRIERYPTKSLEAHDHVARFVKSFEQKKPNQSNL